MEWRKIASKENGAEVVSTIVSPKLTSLELDAFKQINSFYPGKHTIKWPLLKKLEVGIVVN